MDGRLRCLLQKRLGSIRFCIAGTRRKLSKEFVSRRGTEEKSHPVLVFLGFGFWVLDFAFLGSWTGERL